MLFRSADMLHSLRARFPRLHIVHAPCAVQGADAAPTKGMKAALDEYTRRVDALIARWRRLETAIPKAGAR